MGQGPRDLRGAVWIAVLVALGLVLFHRGHLSSGDEAGLFETTRSLAVKGSLSVPPGPNTVRGPDGGRYSLYAVGQAVLAVPLHELGRWLGSALPEPARAALAGPPLRQEGVRYGGSVEIFAVLLFGPVVTGLLAAVFYAFERRLGAGPGAAAVASGLLAFTSHAATLSTYFLRHSGEALALLSGFLVLHRWRAQGGAGRLAVGTALAASSILLRFPCVVAAPGLGLYVLLGWRERSREGSAGRFLPREAAAAGAALLGVAAIHAVLNHLRWGTWLQAPMLGEASRFPYPVYVSGWGFLLSPGDSVFVYTPLLLLLPWTLRRFRREHPAETLAIGVIAVSFLAFFSLYDGWTGFWSAPGPRYLFVPTVLAMLPLGPWLSREASRAGRWAAAALAALGLAVQVPAMATSFAALAQEQGYAAYEPKWSFVFIPEVSPPVQSARAFLSGAHNEMWIVRLARGASDRPPAPRGAAAVGGVWALAVLLASLGLARTLRAGTTRPAASTAASAPPEP